MTRQALFFCSLLVAMAVNAPVLADAGKTVHFSACSEAGVEGGCVVAKGDDGKTYDVTGTVKPNTWLQGSANVTNRVTICMQGATIDNFLADKIQKPADCSH